MSLWPCVTATPSKTVGYNRESNPREPVNTSPSMLKSSFGRLLKPLAVPRPHNVHVDAAASGAGWLSGSSHALCDRASVPDARRNCTCARKDPPALPTASRHACG